MNNLNHKLAAVLVAVTPISTIPGMVQAQQCNSSNAIVPTLAVQPSPSDASKCEYNYTLAPGKVALNKISYVELSHDCSLTASGPNVSEHPCGAGGTANTSWDIGEPVKVDTITPQFGTALFPIKLLVDKNNNGCPIGDVGFFVKAGSVTDGCITQGPVPGVNSVVSASFECVNVNQTVDPGNGSDIVSSTSFGIERGQDLCISTLTAHEQPDCQGPGMNVPAGTSGPNDVYHGTLRGEICPESLTSNTGSPFLKHTIVSGGRPYLVCIDLATGKFVALSFCG